MTAENERAGAGAGPVLTGRRVTIRPGRPGDAERFHDGLLMDLLRDELAAG